MTPAPDPSNRLEGGEHEARQSPFYERVELE